MSLEKADSLAPQISLSNIIDNLAPQRVEVDRVIVMAPSYLKSLGRILSDTPKDIQHIYFFWKVIQAYSSSVEIDAVASYKRFVNELNGKVRTETFALAELLMRNRTRIQLPKGGGRASITWTVV
jgi:predicted metalloendopeptidase